MNYFTPERLIRLQDRSDEARFLAALDDWEGAVEGYRQHLLQFRGKLPADLQQLLDAVCLHDARVLDMWWGGRSQFTITLHPEAEPSRLVVLVYSLLGPPLVVPDTWPGAVRSEPVTWLYDELGPGGTDRRGEPAFVHCILLSDGREVRLRFRNASVKRPIPLVPAVPEGDAGVDSIRHSA